MANGYDMVVVGLGHAGCEAALAGARLGLSVLGVTLRREGIAVMSCNPSIGGTAKGHLVRELDALGGQMAVAADAAGTHFKLLNASRGPAVRASRLLCDRELYAAAMRAALEAQPGLALLEGEARSLEVEDGRVVGLAVETVDGAVSVAARAVVLTTGTFLQAVMHTGEHQAFGGRVGDAAAVGLSASLRAQGFALGRFKTGTPARLYRGSIDFSCCERQPTDPPRSLSLRTQGAALRGGAIDCHITYTQPSTHDVVRRSLSRSPLFQGRIGGRGPRYCPSLEDKVVRFADRERHQVFLEPEGPSSELVYPAGLSTSLPADAQLDLLRTIPGLSRVEVARYGYAVEYDYAPPTQLLPTLETRTVRGLYFAGQLNGTSGYEEAAVQGLLAGLNAARALRGEPELVLGRDQAHAGVLVDELTTAGVDEPFRMFTARSEHRLVLREGNADLRLAAVGHQAGLLPREHWARVEERRRAIDGEVTRLRAGPLAALLRRPESSYASLSAVDLGRRPLPADVVDEVEVQVKYEGYIAQAARAALRYRRDRHDAWAIPAGLEYHAIRGLSREAAEKLSGRRPVTVGQARRIPGVTPAAIDLLLIHLRRLEP